MIELSSSHSFLPSPVFVSNSNSGVLEDALTAKLVFPQYTKQQVKLLMFPLRNPWLHKLKTRAYQIVFYAPFNRFFLRFQGN